MGTFEYISSGEGVQGNKRYNIRQIEERHIRSRRMAADEKQSRHSKAAGEEQPRYSKTAGEEQPRHSKAAGEEQPRHSKAAAGEKKMRYAGRRKQKLLPGRTGGQGGRLRNRIALGAVILIAGTVTAWGLRHSESGEMALGHRIMQYSDGTSRYGADSGTDAWIADPQKLLVLVNKDHRLPEDYEVNLHWLNNGSCAVAEEMYDALRDMLTDGSADGREFVVASGYRDAAYQQQLLDEDIQASMESEGLTWQQAYDKETRETMPPGYSEHETGLAVDIVSLDYQVLDEQQEYTAENQWLRENCSRYGFILRYPNGTEEITGIDYESWHFRYVGQEAAEDIMSRGITLEEYLGAA